MSDDRLFLCADAHPPSKPPVNSPAAVIQYNLTRLPRYVRHIEVSRNDNWFAH